jgi:hypothetical protein
MIDDTTNNKPSPILLLKGYTLHRRLSRETLCSAIEDAPAAQPAGQHGVRLQA